MEHTAPRGHLFVIDGDLNYLCCDAVLVPSSFDMGFSSGLWSKRVPNPAEVRRLTAHDRVSGWKVIPDRRASEPQVWIGNVGLNLPDTEPYVAVAEKFVEDAHEALKSEIRCPRLALGVVGTGEGGMRGNKGDMVEALVRRLFELADRLSVDIVLVAWGVDMYAACQRARKRVQPNPRPLGELIDCPDIERVDSAVSSIAASVRSRRLVAFVGAGVSMGAGLPSWKGLLDELALEAGGPLADLDRLHLLDPRDQAMVIQKRLGKDTFRAKLNDKFSTKDYALAHGLLASLDPHEVVTTNYDALMEQAFGEFRRPAVLPYAPVGTDGRWLPKLHGTIDELASIVLTRDDYLGLPERSQALFGIVQAMLMTRHMLFVGYSLSDDSFHRVVHDVRRARGHGQSDTKLGTVLTLFEDPLLSALWGGDLDIVPVAQARDHISHPAERSASRQLDIVLDRIGLLSADVTSFLLDDTYASMLDRHEETVRDDLLQLMGHLDGSSPIDVQVREMLATVLRSASGDVQDSAGRP
ncbi:MAG: SIR2 family protein [Actinobacteria bacterium]|nr:SIR2 family protein [Actinomycetota bacterium]